jgi:hypothetical protein
MSVLIKGGRIITAADDYLGDVFVEDETVTLIGESLVVAADKIVDAAGKLLLPGTRAQVIVENDELLPQPGAGSFIRRARYGEELPARAVAE